MKYPATVGQLTAALPCFLFTTLAHKICFFPVWGFATKQEKKSKLPGALPLNVNKYLKNKNNDKYHSKSSKLHGFGKTTMSALHHYLYIFSAFLEHKNLEANVKKQIYFTTFRP